jgi:hypothetical protein
MIIVADRGTVKTYKVWHTPAHGPQLELLEQHGFPEAHQSFRDQTTDQSGVFPNRAIAGHGNSIPERQSFEAETERRGIKAVAETISSSLRRTRPQRWYLACPSEVHTKLVEHIPSHLRVGLIEVIKADLTHAPTSEIIRHLGSINGQI